MKKVYEEEIRREYCKKINFGGQFFLFDLRKRREKDGRKDWCNKRKVRGDRS